MLTKKSVIPFNISSTVFSESSCQAKSASLASSTKMGNANSEYIHIYSICHKSCDVTTQTTQIFIECMTLNNAYNTNNISFNRLKNKLVNKKKQMEKQKLVSG